VHDRWAAHFGCAALGHQICLAHLFRDLNYIEQVHGSLWAGSLKTILKDAIILSKQANYDALSDNPARGGLAQSLLDLLGQQLPDKDKLAIRLQKKLRKISQHILCFLHYNHVPPDNNGSERAIRTIKVKQKVSGGFRSIDGADAFAVIRSVIDTTIKSTQNVFQSIALIANFSPE
jgi:transposase